MRASPSSAYFKDDFEAVVEQARTSDVTIHALAEGEAGAIAVAVAAAWASAQRESDGPSTEMLEIVLEHTSVGETRSGIERALSLEFSREVLAAVEVLGHGQRVTAPDTVPFTLWCAARHIDDFTEALWTVASAGGDNDTNGAIVGGIVVLANGIEAIPQECLQSREPRRFESDRLLKHQRE